MLVHHDNQSHSTIEHQSCEPQSEPDLTAWCNWRWHELGGNQFTTQQVIEIDARLRAIQDEAYRASLADR